MIWVNNQIPLGRANHFAITFFFLNFKLLATNQKRKKKKIELKQKFIYKRRI